MGTPASVSVFDVPVTTLKDRLPVRVKYGSKPGPAPYLTEEEERELVEFFFYSSGSTEDKAGGTESRYFQIRWGRMVD